MKISMITAMTVLALGVAPASAAKAPTKPVFQAPSADGLVPNEEDNGRRFMRSWRDQDAERFGGGGEQSSSDPRVIKGLRGSADGAPEGSSWRDEGRDDSGARPPKPRG